MQNTIDKNQVIEFYHKLHRCLDLTIKLPDFPNGDSPSVHTNTIIVEIARILESGWNYYNASMDSWCDYFISTVKDQFPESLIVA